MRNNIQQYKRLEIEADNMKVKISRLEEIHRYYEEFKQKKLELNLASYISKRLTYQVYLNQISNLQKDVASSEARLEEITSIKYVIAPTTILLLIAPSFVMQNFSKNS